MIVIRAQGLSRWYGRRVGVEAIDLDVPGGSRFGFLGPNGAGKTTFIRLMLGFLRPSEGSVEVLGLDAWRGGRRIRGDVGYLPGDLRLYPWMNAASALSIVGRIRGRDLMADGRALADRFELEMRVTVRQMSRGMRQKLGLILALVHRPRLLVLDEPTSGLDPIMQDRLADILRERAADGHTIFFSSHTLSEVEELCDRIAILRRGRIVANETLDGLRERADRVVTLTFGSAEVASSLEPPPFLRGVSREHGRWRCRMTGAAGDLVSWAAAHAVTDLTVGKPDLENLFLRHYREQEP